MQLLAAFLWVCVAAFCGLESVASDSPSIGILWMLGAFTAMGFAAGRIVNEAKHD